MSEALAVLIRDVNSSMPERKLVELIERLNLSADMKAILRDIARVTVRVGAKVLSIGRKIMAFVLDLIKAFPTITLGVIAALVLTSLIAGIPLLGGVLAGMVSTLLVVLGISAGALNDFTNDKLSDRIGALVSSFSALMEV